MTATERLYYEDSHLTVFEATVTEITDRVSGWAGVKLDRTAFYPMGGGQPSDTGFINTARVVECLDLGDAGVLHLIEGPTPAVGDRVTGKVNWPMRMDHMQQHTGQHILSQTFVSLYGAETRAFRMMPEYSEIDIDLENPSEGKIQAAVDKANEIIWEDRPLRVHNVSPEEAARMPLRKDSARDGELRIIEIEQFDMTPCGGTHANRTGEVGAIVVRSWERAKGMTRIVFLAGNRVVADYNTVNSTARSVAAAFSAARDDSPALVEKVIEENKRLSRRVNALEVIAAQVEAAEILAEATEKDGVRIVVRVFEDRDQDSLKRIASAIVAQIPSIALLGSNDYGTARLVFARSADAPGDMNALMRNACELIEGRGGGRAEMAQGGGKRVDLLAKALENAEAELKRA
jgi:alanyl-tRNA synthetase